ncbi:MULTISPECIES: hypothetical protein [unclassified Streptomyces]|uniref:hypothetical protein n=1 Tax=unclassified Streptomyces TaxID=2593676 RepID=UPI0020361DA2|nr:MULTISPECIES: hypothetical protein [unclassified Streptomyces]
MLEVLVVSWRHSPVAMTGREPVVDPYRFAGADFDCCDTAQYGWRDGGRQDVEPRAVDRRRLDLHMALTAAGIAPAAADLAAIEALCTLDDMTSAAVQRWLTRDV